MTKKYYIAPLTSFHAIHAASLLQSASQESLPIHKDENENPVTNPDDVYSRRHRDVWDDEYEEQE